MDSLLNSQIFGISSAFVIYLMIMVIIGWRYMKNNASSSDFFLGGRQVGPWMTALSAEASDMSGWLLMGLPGVAYLGGIKEVFWTALGLAVGTYLNWLFVAKPLRKCTIAFGDSITIPEFFSNRFKDRSHVLAAISVVFILFFFTIYTASGFVACAKLFNSVFGIEYQYGLFIGIAVILLYTIMGGFRAVCATDFIQGMMMFIALMASAIMMICLMDGWESAYAKLADFGKNAITGEFGEAMQQKFTANQSYSVSAIISAMAWGLGYFGMPHILVRFMGIRSNHEIKLSRRIATIWVVIAFIGAWAVGSFGSVYLYGLNDAHTLLKPELAETVFSESIKTMFPSFIAGLFLCGILAAAMSTADSQLLVASSAFSRDIYRAFIHRSASEKTVLNVSRIAVIAIAVIALFLALDPKSSIFGLVSYAWAGFGAAFGPIILLSLFWKGITRNGALAGMILGGLTVIIWKALPDGLLTLGGIKVFGIYEILPGFLVCLLAAVIVSLCGIPNDEIVKEFALYREIPDIEDETRSVLIRRVAQVKDDVNKASLMGKIVRKTVMFLRGNKDD